MEYLFSRGLSLPLFLKRLELVGRRRGLYSGVRQGGQGKEIGGLQQGDFFIRVRSVGHIGLEGWDGFLAAKLLGGFDRCKA